MSKQNGEIFMKDKPRTEDTFEFLLWWVYYFYISE